MKRIYAWRNGKLVEITPGQTDKFHYVQDDVKAFQSMDGAFIEGRAQWREHLKRTDSVEMGHSDIKSAERAWSKKKEGHQEKIRSLGKAVSEAQPTGEIRPIDRSRVGAEIANRLHNRPAPDRKTLIKLTLEAARDIARRR